MAAGDFALLAPHLEQFRCPKGAMLFARGEPATHAYFLEAGVGSLVIVSPQGQRIESGLFGRDGFAPTVLAMGDDRPSHDILIQMEDEAFRMPADPLRAATETSATLRRFLLRYVQTLSVQTAFTALSNALHAIDTRLARWILMCDDRWDGGQLPLTHEFLSLMLGVRRPSVTTALHALEGHGYIRAERGCITVRNRAALEAFAGDAYGLPEAEYARLIGPMR